MPLVPAGVGESQQINGRSPSFRRYRHSITVNSLISWVLPNVLFWFRFPGHAAFTAHRSNCYQLLRPFRWADA